MPTTIEQLYSPVGVPSPLGEAVPQLGQVATQPTGSSQTWGTQQQSDLVTALMGTGTTDVVAPKSTTNDVALVTGAPPDTSPTPPSTGSTVSGDMTSQMLGMENVGGNVGGNVGTGAIDRTVKIEEAVYEEDKELGDIEAGAEGIETKHGKLKSGKAGAREAKKQDRKQDRADRSDAKKACRAAGGSRRKCRKEKGAERKRERKMRRQSWGEYKDAGKKAHREAVGK
jgi:hypothetical protein